MPKMPLRQARKVQQYLRAENLRHGRALERIPATRPTWRSRDFLVVQHAEDRPGVLCRLSINRTMVDNEGEWLEGITWNTLQRLKREAGFGEHDAVEVYPADADLVDVSNMRHLWIMAEPLAFKWGDPVRALEALTSDTSTSSATHST